MPKVLQLSGTPNTSLGSALTRWAALGDTWVDFTVSLSASEANGQTVFRSAGVLSNLWCFVSTNTRNGSTTINTRKALANGAGIITVPSSTTGNFEDVSNTDTVTVGDLWNVQCVVAGTTGSIFLRNVRTVFDATSNSVARHTCPASAGSTAAATYYFSPGGRRDANNTVEANAEIYIGSSATSRNYFVNVATNSRNGTSTFRTRKNGANGNMSISIPSSTTGTFEDSANSDSLVAGDLYCFQNIHGGSSGTLTPTIQSVESESTNGSMFHIYSRPGSGNSVTAGLIQGVPISGEAPSFAASETNIKHITSFETVFSRLSIYVASNSVTDPPDDSFLRFRVAAASTALTIPITAGLSGRLTDITNTVTVATATQINYQIEIGLGDGVGSVNFRTISLTSLLQAGLKISAFEADSKRSLDRQSLRGSDKNSVRKDLVLSSQVRPFDDAD